MPAAHSGPTRSRGDPPWCRSSSAPPPISLRASLQDQAKRHPDSGGDESQAAAYLLGGARVTLPWRPSFCLQRPGFAGG